MVDYTTSKGGSGAGSFGLLLGAAVIVVVVGYALFTGGAAVPTEDTGIIPTQTAPADPTVGTQAVPITD